jgi:hypothetical protein
MTTGVYFLGIKRAGLHPSGAEDKNDCTFIAFSRIFSWYAQGQRYLAFTNGWSCERCIDGLEVSLSVMCNAFIIRYNFQAPNFVYN